MDIAGWNIDVIDDGTTLLVMPTGELDVQTAPSLSRALARYGDNHRVLIVDVTGLTFVDSTGLKTLVDARERAGAGLLLAGTNPVFDRLLELTGTAALFKRSES